MKKKDKKSYHHGDLAESLLAAVDEIASKFGLEAVTLRGCAKLVGVSPSSAFRHYTDKRALLTAFATRALHQLSDQMAAAKLKAEEQQTNPFTAVGLAYIQFALDKPAFFRAMWREDTIYTNDESYTEAANALGDHLRGGFANTLEDHDPDSFSAAELLAWSSVHGLANLFVDGPIGKHDTRAEKMKKARQMIEALAPAFQHPPME
ncbi:MAG: TetR/AcrR family transcriptional regulator [Gammaproteobacteria bacterium]|nr:TetR/AcrR family transcriptional regulator [Gammaproteobacteria bacterium]